MDELDTQLLNMIQTDFPLVSRPYAEIADRLGVSENEVIDRIAALKKEKTIRTIRAMYVLHKLGYVSALVAARVEKTLIDETAAHINTYPGVTHNYLREHEYNVWFTVIARNPSKLDAVIDEVAALSGVHDVQKLPAEKFYKLRVDFKVAT